MAPALKRTRPKQHGHSAEEDSAILAAVTEIEPYAGPDQQKRMRWQQVVERVIADTGNDEITGHYCKRRCASLLTAALSGSDADRKTATADDVRMDMLKIALEKHNKLEDLMNTTASCGTDGSNEEEEHKASHDTTPVTAASRHYTRGSNSEPVVSPPNYPCGPQGKENARRELLSRVTAARAREKNRTKLTSPTATKSPPSVVLSSLIAELEEERPRSPRPLPVKGMAEEGAAVVHPVSSAASLLVQAPTQTEKKAETAVAPPLTEVHEQKSTAQVADAKQTPASTPEVHPSVALPDPQPGATPTPTEPATRPMPQQRSFIANVFQKVWFTRTTEEPAQEAATSEREPSASGERTLAPASDSATRGNENREFAPTVAPPKSAPSPEGMDLQELVRQRKQHQENDKSVEPQKPTATSTDGYYSKLKEALETQQQQCEDRVARMERTIATLAATTQRLQQQQLHMLKLHTRTLADLDEVRKTVAEDRANENRKLLQQIQNAEAATKPNEV